MDKGLSARDTGGLFPRLQQRFGLAADPLEMELPFFAGAMRQQALETLRHLCGFGDLVVLLTAPEGMGKTRILAELVKAESARLDFHRIPASALTGVPALLRDLNTLMRSVPADGEAPPDMLHRFYRWSEKRAAKGRRLVLLIDDAEQAAPEVLQLLLKGFVAVERSLAAVPVLAGTEKLVSVLEAGVDASSWHHIRLPPLQREDVYAYLEPRIRQAGGPVDQLLSTRRLAQICALGDGSFSGIRRAAPAVWLGLAGSGPRASRPRLFARAWLWPGIALVLLAASWWFVSVRYERSLSVRDEVPAPSPVRRSITIGPEVPDPKPPAVPQNASVDTPRDVPAEVPLAVTGLQGSGAGTPALADPLPEPAAGPDAGNLPESETSVPAEAEPVPVMSGTKAGPEPGAVPVSGMARVTAGSDPDPEEQQESGKEQKHEPVAVAASGIPSFVPARPARFVPVPALAGEAGWTVQLVAGRQERTALNLLDLAPDDAALRYTVMERDGAPWFMVVYGQYSDAQAARTAARQLASSFGVSQPWVRSFASFSAH